MKNRHLARALTAGITAAALCFLAAASLFLLPRKTATTATPEPREEETS